MQTSMVRTASTCMANPLLGNRMSMRTLAPSTSTQLGSSIAPTMAKKKGIRLIVTVECTESRALGLTPSRYCTQKNRKNTPERLELKKYNPTLRRVTVHREIK